MLKVPVLDKPTSLRRVQYSLSRIWNLSSLWEENVNRVASSRMSATQPPGDYPHMKKTRLLVEELELNPLRLLFGP